jgi:hypothetical protein
MEVSVKSAQKETCSRIVIAQSSAPLGLVHDPGAFLFSTTAFLRFFSLAVQYSVGVQALKPGLRQPAKQSTESIVATQTVQIA